MGRSWLLVSVKGDPSGNMSVLFDDISSACASSMLTGGSSGDVGGESHIAPPLVAWSDKWPRSQRSLWMRGML